MFKLLQTSVKDARPCVMSVVIVLSKKYRVFKAMLLSVDSTISGRSPSLIRGIVSRRGRRVETNKRRQSQAAVN